MKLEVSKLPAASRPTIVTKFFSAIERRQRLLWRILQGWEPPLWCAATMMTALIVPLRYTVGQNADGLLQTLMSIQRLTLFYWQQDRFANLLPLLASPVTDPVLNAQLQLALRICLGVAAPLLFCVTGASRRDILQAGRTTLLASALALAAVPQRMLHEWFVEASPYGTSFALGGFALVMFALAPASGRGGATTLRLAGLLLTVAAYMVNASLVLVTLPLFGAQAVLFGSPIAAEFCIASLVGILVTLLASGSVHTPKTSMRFGESLIGLQHYATELVGKQGYFLWAMLALFVVTAILSRKPSRSAFIYEGLALHGTFAVALLGVSLSSWVLLNYFNPRYLVPLYVLMAAVGAKAALRLLEQLSPRQASMATLGLCAILLMVAGHRKATFVGDDNGIVDANVRPLARAVSEVISAQHLDAVAGSYWQVWPSVFLAEQRAHELGHPAGGIFGLTLRGDTRREALLARLSANGALTVACIDLTNDACRDAAIATTRKPLQVRPLQISRMIEGHQVSIVSLIREDALEEVH